MCYPCLSYVKSKLYLIRIYNKTCIIKNSFSFPVLFLVLYTGISVMLTAIKKIFNIMFIKIYLTCINRNQRGILYITFIYFYVWRLSCPFRITARKTWHGSLNKILYLAHSIGHLTTFTNSELYSFIINCPL